MIDTTWRGRRRTARCLPADDDRCGWLETLTPPSLPPRSLAGDEDCDVAVVGAGFTGLAAARRLAELAPGSRVGVVEAQRVGHGSSGRSSGFIVDLASFIAAMPPEHGERFIRLSRAGIASLKRVVGEQAIDCAWDEAGILHAAAGDAGLASLHRLHRWLAARGEVCRWLDEGALRELLGTSFYRAGVRLPESVIVHSGALVRGLAATLPAGVEVFERSPVRAIERLRDGRLRLESDAGTLTARRLVLALNAYFPGLGFLARRIFPLITYGSLTRPLTPAEQRILGGENEWGLLAQDPMGSSLRRTRDQRLLIRNFLSYDRSYRVSSELEARVQAQQREGLARRFPELGEIPFSHSWSGLMGATANRYPFFGRLGEGVVAAGGYSGAGIAMGTICGQLLAELLHGVASDLLADQERLPRPRWIPPEPFLSPGIRFQVARLNASAGESL